MEQELKKIKKQVTQCTKCELSKTRNNSVPGKGNFKSDVIFVGEAPGKNEDMKGEPFIGIAGKKLSIALENAGITRDDVYITNIVKCRPPKNRVPTTNERDTCQNYLKKEIEIIKPKRSYSTYSFNYDSFIKRFVDSLVDISKLSDSIQENILNAKFEEIMLYLVEFKGVEFLYSLISNSSNEHQKFIQTIESNQLNKLTIKELSFISNMSVSTFKREFEKHFRSTPSKWFQEKRLEHAAFLLKNNSKRPSDIFEEIGNKSSRNRIEHAQIIHADDINRFVELGVIPSMQSTHCTSDMYWVDERLGPKRLHQAYPWNSLLNTGSIIPGGSDAPVEIPDPLLGIYAAITRKDINNWPKNGWLPYERMTIDQAISSITEWSAYSMFAEKFYGKIGKGYLADFTVLNNNLTEIDPKNIPEVKVLYTFVNGEIVYQYDK